MFSLTHFIIMEGSLEVISSLVITSFSVSILSYICLYNVMYVRYCILICLAEGGENWYKSDRCNNSQEF